MGKTIRRSFIRTWMGESTNWECMFVHRKQGLRIENVDDIKMAGKKQNVAPMWKKLMKNVDLDEPTSFLDHVYLGCTQRECKPNETIIEQYTKMFESRISAKATEELTGWEKPHAQTVARSHDMEGHVQKCVERYCEVANKKVEQLYRVSNPSLDCHRFRQEELESVGELSEVCSQTVSKYLYLARIVRPDILWSVLKCLYLARIGRPDILWSVNKLARSITKWTKACDKRLCRLISYIHHTCAPCGRSTSLQDQSQNGLRHVTDDWRV